MLNPILLCEVANLHQRETEKEIALTQTTKKTNSTQKISLKLVKHFVMLSFSSQLDDQAVKAREVFSR